jgi:glycosyltransferase involved in cell wall biosynthesis
MSQVFVTLNDTSRRIKIQIVDRFLPIDAMHGGAAYVLDIISYLHSVGFEIEYVCLNSSPGAGIPWKVVPKTLSKCCSIVVKDNVQIGPVLCTFGSLTAWITAIPRVMYEQLPKRLKTVLQARLRPRMGALAAPTPVFDAVATQEEIEFVRTRALEFRPDVMIAVFAWLADVLSTVAATEAVLRLVLTEDVLHQRMAAFKNLGIADPGWGTDWSRQQESLLLQRAQVLLAIQAEEARTLQEMVPTAEVIHTPISVKLHHTNGVSQVAGRCLFVSSRASHNVYGLLWFLQNVWPRVREGMPDACLHVCGDICQEIDGAFPGVRLLGRLANLEPEYAAAQLCIVPILAGSGLKIKLVEAMSYGRACVVTNSALQGLSELAGRAVLVGDSPEEFAQAMISLCSDPEQRHRLEEEASRQVQARFSPQAAYGPFVNRIRQHVRQTQGVRNA